MKRQLSDSSASNEKVTAVVSPTKGGTGVDSINSLIKTYAAIPSSALGVPNGIAASDINGKIPARQLPTVVIAGVTIDGPTVIVPSQTVQFTITNYDVATPYSVQVSAGTVSVAGNTITYVAPATAQSITMVVNGRECVFQIQPNAPSKPSIVAPVASGVIGALNYNFTCSAYIGNGLAQSSSDWQISAVSTFATVAFQTVNDNGNLTSWAVSGLLDNTSYYVRVRHNAVNGSVSEWSDARAFSILIPLPAAPDVTVPANNATGIAQNVTVSASAFAAIGDASTHVSTDWQLATDSGFATVVRTTIDDTANKTSWSLTGLDVNTNYYLRVRYKASNGKVGPWSTVSTFKTITAFAFNPVIAANATNYNMRNMAVGAGWDQITPLLMSVTINTGVSVGSTTTGTYAFDTGTTYPSGTVLSVVNNGSIVGMGGGGGSGGQGYDSPNGGSGGSGGPAFIARTAVTFTNNGTIGGGGGGGGGGAGTQNQPGGSTYAGGAGGTGAGVSAATSGAAGGDGAASGLYGRYGGNGGSGGALGAAGGAGGTAANNQGGASIGSPGGGGAAGAAVTGNANINWLANGTRLGSIG